MKKKSPLKMSKKTVSAFAALIAAMSKDPAISRKLKEKTDEQIDRRNEKGE